MMDIRVIQGVPLLDTVFLLVGTIFESIIGLSQWILRLGERFCPICSKETIIIRLVLVNFNHWRATKTFTSQLILLESTFILMVPDLMDLIGHSIQNHTAAGLVQAWISSCTNHRELYRELYHALYRALYRLITTVHNVESITGYFVNDVARAPFDKYSILMNFRSDTEDTIPVRNPRP